MRPSLFRQNFSYIFSLALMFLSFTYAAQATTKIIFLTEEWKPFNFTSKEKDVVGFSVAIVEKIAKNLNTKISISIHPWSRAYYTALKNKDHAVFSMYRIKPREKLFKWVGPIYQVDTILWGLKSRNLKIKNLEDAKKYRIIVQSDSAYEYAIKERGFRNYVVNSIQTDAYMVVIGRGDLLPLSAFSLEKLNKVAADAGKSHEKWKDYAVLYSEPLYIGFNINTPDSVIKKWQAELEKIKKSPYFSKLKEKFIEPVIHPD